MKKSLLNQFTKELKRFINDKRITLSFHASSINVGCLRVEVYFSNKFLASYHFNDVDCYNDLFDCLKYIQSVHPTRKNQSVLMRLKKDSGKTTRYKITNESDYEMLSASSYQNVSNELKQQIDYAFSYDQFKKVYDRNYGSYVSSYDYSYIQDVKV